MTLQLTIRPAMLADLPALKPCLSRKAFAGFVQQFSNSAAVAVECAGRVRAAGGLFNQLDHFELWFMAANDLRGSREAFGVLRLLQHALAAVPAGQPVRTYVARGNAAGLRLARLSGFTVTGSDDDGPFLHLTVARSAATITCAPQQTNGAG